MLLNKSDTLNATSQNENIGTPTTLDLFKANYVVDQSNFYKMEPMNCSPIREENFIDQIDEDNDNNSDANLLDSDEELND